jgi:hypothetical protein
MGLCEREEKKTRSKYEGRRGGNEDDNGKLMEK